MSTWYSNPAARAWTAPPVRTGALAFHRSLPDYAPTPLVEVPELAAELGVSGMWVKDESSRLGLPAFKALGASWACHRVLERAPGSRLVTATDGNHGRAVARMARLAGVDATVFVPEVTPSEVEGRIGGEGADVVRVAGSYDEAVQQAAAFVAADARSILVQDTAWPGYEEVPAWIVEGYDTLLVEVDEQLGRAPDMVAVPVGVGSLAEAVVRHYRAPGGPRPVILSVEPVAAACLLASLLRGRSVTVPTGATIMAGLNCGTVSSGAWPVLRAGCDAAVAVEDASAARAVEDLGRLGISSGPSGAASLAGVRAAARELALPSDAVVVLLSTEARS